MGDQATKGKRSRRAAVAPGEFGHLLSQIEKEAVPERLLDLARRLQAALVRQRQEDQQAVPPDEKG